MVKGLPSLRQTLATFGLLTLLAQANAARKGGDPFAGEQYPANFTLLGGYVRGKGDYLNPGGRTATPNTLSAMGGGTTGLMIDSERDLTFIFLPSGLVEGFEHPRRLERLADLAIAALVR